MKLRASMGQMQCGLVAAILPLLMFALTGSTRAQFGPGRGPSLAPEKQEAAWAIESKSVATELKISDEAAGKLTEAYKAARKSFRDGAQKLMQESQGDRMAAIQGTMELRGKEAEKFEAALKGKLEDAQIKSAMASLGSFNQTWDLMVDTLAEMKLEEKKQADALKAVKTYIEAANKVQNDAMANMDFQSLREEMQKLKQKLDEDLTPILSADQLAQWKTKTTFRRGPGGGARGPGREPGGPSQGGNPSPPPKSDK